MAIQNGDLIFHESQSQQSAAIQEATHSNISHVGLIVRDGSRWLVYEAVGPVKFSSLSSFKMRGVGGRYVIKRVRPDIIDMGQVSNQAKLAQAVRAFHGKGYDIFFEWTDDVIYCSELVWKGFFSAFGYAPGTLQKLKDLDFSGPIARALLEERARIKPTPVNWDEPILTPASLFQSGDLITIEEKL